MVEVAIIITTKKTYKGEFYKQHMNLTTNSNYVKAEH
jgi:hypothetical protein